MPGGTSGADGEAENKVKQAGYDALKRGPSVEGSRREEGETGV